MGRTSAPELDELTLERLTAQIDAACARIDDHAFLTEGVDRLRGVEQRNSAAAARLLGLPVPGEKSGLKQLVCLADTPWSGVPARTQQLMARLKQVQILYFEPPARRRGKPWKQPGRRVRPGLVVYALPPVLDEEENSRLIFRAGQRKLERYVEKVLLRHRVQDPVLWCASPSAVHLLDAVPSRGIVYDCGRDWSHLPDQWESELALAADVVFAASPELADHIGPCSDNVALLPNGATTPCSPG